MFQLENYRNFCRVHRLICVSVSTCVAFPVDMLDIEEQQEQAEADDGCHCTAQQEGVTALTVDHLQTMTKQL